MGPQPLTNIIIIYEYYNMQNLIYTNLLYNIIIFNILKRTLFPIILKLNIQGLRNMYVYIHTNDNMCVQQKIINRVCYKLVMNSMLKLFLTLIIYY